METSTFKTDKNTSWLIARNNTSIYLLLLETLDRYLCFCKKKVTFMLQKVTIITLGPTSIREESSTLLCRNQTVNLFLFASKELLLLSEKHRKKTFNTLTTTSSLLLLHLSINLKRFSIVTLFLSLNTFYQLEFLSGKYLKPKVWHALILLENELEQAKSQRRPCGQSYKDFTIVNYDSAVVNISNFVVGMTLKL